MGARHLAAVGLAGAENEAEVGGWLRMEVGGGSRGLGLPKMDVGVSIYR